MLSCVDGQTDVYPSRDEFRMAIHFSNKRNNSQKNDPSSLTMTTTDPSSVLKQGDVLRLEVSPQYATIRVLPNGNEGNDANFPRNLHNAAELFLKCGMVPQAVKLKECVDGLLQTKN